jgi:hypothetical protein
MPENSAETSSSIDQIRSRIVDGDYQFAHQLIFGDGYSHEPAPFHESMIDLFWSDTEKSLFASFRGSAKSSIAENAFTIGAVTEAFHYAVVLASTVERAIDKLGSIRKALERNEIVEEVFGNQRGEVWQQTRIVLANGVCIDAQGAGQEMRGMKRLRTRL